MKSEKVTRSGPGMIGIFCPLSCPTETAPNYAIHGLIAIDGKRSLPNSAFMSDQRIATGVLERHFSWLFLKTDAGHRWRLEIDERRVTDLIGLRAQVKGSSKSGTIVVEGIFPA